MSLLKQAFKNSVRYVIVSLTIVITTPIAFATVKLAESLLSQGKFDLAIINLEPLASKNDPKALYLLSTIYITPQYGHLDMAKGVALLEKAVYQNYAPAFNTLADLYLAGDGVAKSEARALHYYRQGSYLGYGPSQFNCGIMYKDGQGTPKDPEQAYLHLCLASLNRRDLDDVTLDAAKYRDELAPLLTANQRQEVLRQVNLLTLPMNYNEKDNK